MSPHRWQIVKEIFQNAILVETTERAAFLDRACAGDAEIRQCVDEMLASDREAGDLLTPPPGALAAVAGFGSSVESLPASRIGAYRVLREIGQGGMGAVYLAERVDGEYRQRVAIKLIRAGSDNQTMVKRFRQERQVLAVLEHPGIARLLDGGSTGEGLPYLVMEYVEGTRIDSWCDEHKLRVADRVKLFLKVCAAVQYAHDKQVIHRDIKPGNILVTADGEPKLLDFGIAKTFDPELGSEIAETTVGVRPMTPEYASPEQKRGGLAGPASDVYSLGVVLYRLLTGGLPATQEPEGPSAAMQARAKAGEQTPAGLHGRRATDLDYVVLRALRPEPGQRYSSVREFSDDLERVLGGVRVRRQQPASVIRRNGPILLVAPGAVLMVALVAWAAGWLPTPPIARNPAARSIAVMPLENLSGDPREEYFADGMTEALIDELAQIRSLRVIARDSVMRYKGVRKLPAAKARELRVDALAEGAVIRSGDRVRISVQLLAGAMDRVQWAQTYDRDIKDVLSAQGDAAQAIAREIEARLSPVNEARLSAARTVDRRAFEAYLKGRYETRKYTSEGFAKAIQYFKEAIDIDPSYALPWAGLADGYYSQSTLAMPPQEAIPRAKAAVARALEIDKDLAEALATLATIQAQYDWDWAAAEVTYKRAIELNPSYAFGRRYYSVYLAELGRTDEAIREAEEVYRLDPLPPMMSTNLGWIYCLARRPDDAIAQFRRVLAIEPDSTVTHYSLGQAYVQKRMFEEAMAEFQKTRGLDEDFTDSVAVQGYVQAVSGRAHEARQRLQDLLGLSRRRYVSPWGIALVYAGLGDRDKAFEWLETAYRNRDEGLLTIKVDPLWDSLRSDPRLASLLRRLGLPP